MFHISSLLNTTSSQGDAMGLNYFNWLLPLKVTLSHLSVAEVWFQKLTTIFKMLDSEIYGNSTTSLITHFILNPWLNITKITSLKRIFHCKLLLGENQKFMLGTRCNTTVSEEFPVICSPTIHSVIPNVGSIL